MTTVRAELAKRSAAEAAARTEILQLTGQLEAKEREWTTNLNAERERSDGIARELAVVRTELGNRVNAEAAARKELAESARRLEANEKEWTTKLKAERERSDGIAKDLAGVRAELVAARIEVSKSTTLLETNEKEWTTKLNAERERSNSVVRDLAAAGPDLAAAQQAQENDAVFLDAGDLRGSRRLRGNSFSASNG